MNIIVTTVYDPDPPLESAARAMADELQAVYVPRQRRSFAVLRGELGVETILVATQSGPVVYTTGGEFFFHLSMAELRIKNLKNGKHDHMIASMGLHQGMTVLDCTLGLGTDAIVASYAAGPWGAVTGLESSSVVAMVVREGMLRFSSDDDLVNQAMRRIKVITADYRDYLKNLPANSFDVVYFDPMFRQPIKSSSSLRPLRYLANNSPLDPEALSEAQRVARKRVVIKETKDSNEFDRLGVKSVVGGKYSSVQYGVIEAGG